MDELEDARWFRADELRVFTEFSDDPTTGYQFPRRDSIARLLIDQWLEDNP
jgi:NAD+ diphosphatase